MNRELEKRWLKMLDRHAAEMMELLTKYPEDRFELTHEVMGAAIGVCDVFGSDPTAVFTKTLRNIRSLAGDPPAPLVPRKSAGS